MSSLPKMSPSETFRFPLTVASYSTNILFAKRSPEGISNDPLKLTSPLTTRFSIIFVFPVIVNLSKITVLPC